MPSRLPRSASLRRLAAAKVTAQVQRTLIELIAENRLEHIDLLKVDVEGVEGRVLAGIAEADGARSTRWSSRPRTSRASRRTL